MLLPCTKWILTWASCYVKLKNPPSLKKVPAMSVHSVTGHDLCPVGLMCYEVTIDKSQFKLKFIFK